MASRQCTMNKFTFGNAHHQYYEIIAGGSGAGDGFAGPSVVTPLPRERSTATSLPHWPTA
jgi:5-oxoprolinase (ATP-hydrolysing)